MYIQYIMSTMLSLFLLLSLASYSFGAFTPAVIPAKFFNLCGQNNFVKSAEYLDFLEQVHHQLGPPGCNPPRNRSCQEILYCFPSASSDYYQIHAANGSLIPVYCNMEGTNCGNTTGWTRVAYLNMTQPGATCPQSLNLETRSGLTLCYRHGSGCHSTVYSTLGLSYSQVCGQVRAYQFGAPDAFLSFLQFGYTSINNAYVDGVSITYGTPSDRKHIWTYVGGPTQNRTTEHDCPCNNNSNAQIPHFVGNDYYCESGTNNATDFDILYNTDPLWDGQECTGLEGPCCSPPNMPWFINTLDQETSEDIELRLCFNRVNVEDTPVEIVELYVR